MSGLDHLASELRKASASIERANLNLSKCREIAELQLEVGPGVCCFCEEPIPPTRPDGRGRPAMNCGSVHCRKSHLRLLHAPLYLRKEVAR